MLFDTLYPLYVLQVSIYYKLVTNLRADVGVTFNYIPIFASIGWLLFFFVAELTTFQNIINYVLAYHDIIPKSA